MISSPITGRAVECGFLVAAGFAEVEHLHLLDHAAELVQQDAALRGAVGIGQSLKDFFSFIAELRESFVTGCFGAEWCNWR